MSPQLDCARPLEKVMVDSMKLRWGIMYFRESGFLYAENLLREKCPQNRDEKRKSIIDTQNSAS